MAEDDLRALMAWVKQESPTSDPSGVNAMGALVAQEAGACGLATEWVAAPAGSGNMLVIRGGPDNGADPVVMMGHLDTVHPLGSTAGPMPVRHHGDRLYGPGVYDMKAGILIALRAMSRAYRTAARPILFILSPDEEIGSPFSGPVIKQLARHAHCALVFEPARAGGGCITSRKGIGRLEIELEGVAAHSGMRHEDGRSAIAEAARQILAIEALTDHGKGLTASVGLIAGGTAVNTVPATCRLSVDLRAISADDALAGIAAIRALQPVGRDIRLKMTGGLIRPPFERSEGTLTLLRRAQEIAGLRGLALPEAPRTGGGSDGNFTAAMGIPTLDALGAEGHGAHTPDEFALLSSIEQRQLFIADLLKAL